MQCDGRQLQQAEWGSSLLFKDLDGNKFLVSSKS